MLRILAFLGLLASGSAALAQSVYKCTIGGRVTYASAPCDSGSVSALTVPKEPAPDPAAAGQLKHEQALLATLLKQRADRDARDARAFAKAEQAGNKRNQRCAKAALQKRWADEDARRAAGFDKEALRHKAKRKGEAMAVECPA